MKTDPRVDAYIARQAVFARPILEHLRAVVHAACPQIEETLKWGAPSFTYKGGIVAGMAGFKAHVALNFWKGTLVTGDMPGQAEAMGQFGRIGSLDDLPDRATLEALVKKAVTLADQGVKAPRGKHPKPALETPADLAAALDENPAARAVFDGFPPGARREYVEWITGAKRAETRTKRLAQAVEWLAEGKRRNWKYENC